MGAGQSRFDTYTITTTGFPTATLAEIGDLPGGVSFTDNGNGTATLAGTPADTAIGTYYLTFTAQNGVSPQATQSFTLTVQQSQAPAFSSVDNATFTADRPNTFTITTTGFPNASLVESGNLPSGVTFTDNGNGTATLAGTPATGTVGSYNLTLTADNGVSPDAMQSFAITVIAPVPLTFCVDADTPAAASSQNGLSWTTAFAGLQSALADAISGNSIEVAQGIYLPSGTDSQTATFQLLNNIAILGGFGGNELAASGGDPNTRNISAYPSILSGNLVGNDASNSYHVVTGSGTNSTAVLNGFTITDGDANGGGTNGDGGGMYNNDSNPTVNDCTFTGDQSTGDGAGMYNSDSSPLVTDCKFNANTNPVSSTMGGGIDNENSSMPMIVDCSFIANSTYYAGGGMFNDTGCSAQLINCLFLNNLSHGAVGEGAGIANAGTLTLINCTFEGNVATPSGSGDGGIYNSGKVTLTNCILYGDSGPDGEIDNAAGTVTATYSDIQGGFTGTGNINANPMFVNVSTNNLELQAGSPCIDAGDSAAVPSNITTDLAGNPRISGNAVDMGAYEFQSQPIQTTFTVNDGNAQRSMIDSLTVTFSLPVTLASGAITLNQVDYASDTTTPQTFTLSNPSGDQETYILTFTGPNYRGGSLSNGFYNLTVHAAMVQGATDGTLSGGDQTFYFYRLFGDFYGTGKVNFSDLLLVAQDYGITQSNPNYLWYMDPDDSGVIDFASLLFVAQDYGDTAQI